MYTESEREGAWLLLCLILASTLADIINLGCAHTKIALTLASGHAVSFEICIPRSTCAIYIQHELFVSASYLQALACALAVDTLASGKPTTAIFVASLQLDHHSLQFCFSTRHSSLRMYAW